MSIKKASTPGSKKASTPGSKKTSTPGSKKTPAAGSKKIPAADIDSTDTDKRNEGARALISEIEAISQRCKGTPWEQTTAANVLNAKRIFGDLIGQAVAVDDQKYFVACLKIELQRAQDAETETL
jgi:hypothetical protein